MRHLSCNETNHHFCRLRSQPGAGNYTGQHWGLNKAMTMPVAGVKNRFVLVLS
jgi:hypothetical protein